MGEFKRGKLKSGSGGKVKNRKQAIAIALSEQRKQGGKMPSYYNSKSSKPKKTKVKKYQGGGQMQEPMTPPPGRRGYAAPGTSGRTHVPGLVGRSSYHSDARDALRRNPPPRGVRDIRGIGPGMKGGGSVNQLIDKKYKHGGRIPHNPSDVNP